MVYTKEFENAIQKAVSPEYNKKRNFVQTVETVIKLREIDVKKEKLRINETIELPNPIEGKEPKICVITDRSFVIQARELKLPILTKEEIQRLEGNKKEIRKIVNSYDFFIAEAPLMPLIGRIMGQFLGPRDKMPIPVPPTGDIKPVVERLKRSVKIRMRNQPLVRGILGNEKMEPSKMAENMEKIFNVVVEKLPRRERNVDFIGFKTTMGKMVKMEITGGKKK